jgi:hypothetical protein
MMTSYDGDDDNDNDDDGDDGGDDGDDDDVLVMGRGEIKPG